MKIAVVSEYRSLAEEVADAILPVAPGGVHVRNEKTASFELRHRPGSPPPETAQVVKALRPMEPDIVADDSLTECDVALHLGDAKPLAVWRPKLISESEEVRTALCSAFQALGFARPRVEEEAQMVDQLQFGGASAFARCVILWRLARQGCRPVQCREWGEDDLDIFIRLVDPKVRDRSPAERVMIEVRSDDSETAIAATEQLACQGFTRSEVKLIDEGSRRGLGAMLTVDPGPLARFGHDTESARLMTAADRAAARAGIDPRRHPVRLKPTGSARAVLHLPVRACVEGRAPPYAGPHPERFDVSLLTDDRRASGALIKEFRARGFTRITRRSLDDVTAGFRVLYGALASEPSVLEAVREAVEAHMNEIGADLVSLIYCNDLPSDSTEIIVKVPSLAFKEGRLMHELENPVLYELFVQGGGADAIAAVTKTVKGLGFVSVKARSGGRHDKPRLAFGAAPRPLLDKLRAAVREATGTLLPLIRELSVTDRKIRIVLPDDGGAAEESLAPAPPRSSGTRASPSGPRNGRTFLRVRRDYVEIAGLRLKRLAGNDLAHVPRLDRLRPFCLDAITAETICHIAWAVLRREPCALEGPTSTSKTSSIMYVAALLNQPIFRLNLNGQTDTGELIGRYVPAEDGGWRFQEGLLVTAMRKGYWILLDEINLAEAAILERMNSILERHPSLVISDHDNGVIDEPHENFRIFATFNPVGVYVGREPMSPAFRDRWAAYRFVPRAGESEYLALARLAVFGEQPAITVHDQHFDGCAEAAVFGNLARVRRIGDFLAALARFHVSVEAAAEPDANGASRLGSDRRECYVVTRRGFLNTLACLDRMVENDPRTRVAAASAWRAIQRYYFNRIADPADLRTVIELAHAAGIFPASWKKSK